MTYSLNKLFKVVGISRQAVNMHLRKQIQFDLNLHELLIQVDHLRSIHPGCGLAKMYDTLQPDFLGRDKFIALMMKFGYRLRYPKNYIRTTYPASFHYENLIEGALINDINRVWQTDITYIYIGGRFYYLIFILDVYSRRILGYSATDHMRAEANVLALKQCLRLRIGEDLYLLVHHSDRGSQYSSNVYTSLLEENLIKISMCRQAQENAYAERVNGIIKNEFLLFKKIDTLRKLKKELKIAVEYYNHKRIHYGLPGKLSPVQFEEQHKLKKQNFNEYIYSLNDKTSSIKKAQKNKLIISTNNWHCPLLEYKKEQKS